MTTPTHEEAIARIVDPEAFVSLEEHMAWATQYAKRMNIAEYGIPEIAESNHRSREPRRQDALSKARQIIAYRSQQEEEGEPSGVIEADMTRGQIEQWIDACNHEPARDVLRHYLRLVAQEEGGWRSFDQLPDIGRKFVALYSDGSGAAMFWRHDAGFIDQDGNEWSENDHWETAWKVNYDRWAYLPADLGFWCEVRADDPMSLSLPTPPQPSPAREEGGGDA